MKKDLTQEEIEKRFKEINAREQAEPTPEDLIALSKSALESAEDAITLEEYKTQKEYSGRLMIRIPKELHRDLIEAAKKNGVLLPAPFRTENG